MSTIPLRISGRSAQRGHGSLPSLTKPMTISRPYVYRIRQHLPEPNLSVQITLPRNQRSHGLAAVGNSPLRRHRASSVLRTCMFGSGHAISVSNNRFRITVSAQDSRQEVPDRLSPPITPRTGNYLDRKGRINNRPCTSRD